MKSGATTIATTTTDENGAFSVTVDQAGCFTVEATLSGYDLAVPTSPAMVTANQPNVEGCTVFLTNNLKTAVPLYSGWNLISLPYEPNDPSTAAILSAIKDTIIVVWGYTPTGWKSYVPGSPFGNDLSSLHAGQGYWIKIKDASLPQTLSVAGSAAPASITLYPGWNLIGVPKTSQLAVDDALVSIAGTFDYVWGYSTFSGWQLYNPSAPSGNALTTFMPSMGYWIKVKDSVGSSFEWALP